VQVDEPVGVVGVANDGVGQPARASEYVGHRLIVASVRCPRVTA
jgi:hypothetical protein